MVENIFSEDGICSVYWNKQIESVVLEWHGTVVGDTYKEYMKRCLDVIVDKQASKLLVDRRHQGRMSEDDREWTTGVWDVQAIEAGLESLAVIYPEDQAAKTSVDIAARESPYLDLERVFTEDAEEARNWLRTK